MAFQKSLPKLELNLSEWDLTQLLLDGLLVNVISNWEMMLELLLSVLTTKFHSQNWREPVPMSRKMTASSSPQTETSHTLIPTKTSLSLDQELMLPPSKQ